ncbi:hypothetical protein LZ31DRAFT_589649 [Colletotrichum somersetense]|nr:hypothetical protein LZ31DRAFT_589649 [Colletotrichum somersetense]
MSTNGKRKASDFPTGPSKNAKLDIRNQGLPNTQERANFIAAEFSKLPGDETVFPKILDQARIDRKHEILNETDGISEYWFNWTVDNKAWTNAMALGKERTCANMTSIQLRQTIWDDVFPGQPCAKNRPFEFAVPTGIDYGALVWTDFAEYTRQLPPGIPVIGINAENPRGTFFNCLVFGYNKGPVDSPWRRIILAAV